MGRGTNHVHVKESGTNHVRVNLWRTIYKLKGLLASLDDASIHSNVFLTTERRPPMPCMTYWFWMRRGVQS